MAENDDTKQSTYKTRVDERAVRLFLENKYGGKASNLKFIQGGETSQAFSFDLGDTGLVLRLNRHGTFSFEKDRQAFLRFAHCGIPVPEIIEIGSLDNSLFFALSKRAEGRIMNDYSRQELVRLMPAVWKILDLIHAQDVGAMEGFGYWGLDGKGLCKSWQEAMLTVGIYGGTTWEARFEKTFMERSLHGFLYGKLSELLVFCPQNRYLVHGDFGFNNLICKNDAVTGVIDWPESRYGDFLYDAAWLTFWPSEFDLKSSVETHYAGRNIENYRERILCYHVYIALNSLGFYADSNQKEKYDWAKQRILSLLGVANTVAF